MKKLQNKIKEQAWKFYNKWREKPSFSPALKNKIKVTLKGWYHIVGGTGNKKRPMADVVRRLYLLPYAKEIIEKSTTIQNIEKRHDRTFYTLEAMVEVEEKGKKAPRRVRVILIEDKKGNKIFYSIMDIKPRKHHQ